MGTLVVTISQTFGPSCVKEEDEVGGNQVKEVHDINLTNNCGLLD